MGLIIIADSKSNVSMLNTDLVSPQPGHGKPVKRMKGQEAWKK